MLLDRIKIEIEENGREPARAVIEAAQRRLRPIVLTTFTTVAGLIPLWYGGGLMYQPMAITIIFGADFRHRADPGGGADFVLAVLSGRIQGV